MGQRSGYLHSNKREELKMKCITMFSVRYTSKDGFGGTSIKIKLHWQVEMEKRVGFSLKKIFGGKPILGNGKSESCFFFIGSSQDQAEQMKDEISNIRDYVYITTSSNFKEMVKATLNSFMYRHFRRYNM
jgi:hypothetical protein